MSDGEGTITTRLTGPVDRLNGPSAITFPPVPGRGATVKVAKNPDQTVNVTVELKGMTFTFHARMPRCDSRGLFVAVTWSNTEVKLYLGGIEAAQEVGRHEIRVH